MKRTISILLAILVIFSLTACESDNGDDTPVNVASAKYATVSEDDFNRDLFYMNTLEFQVADPTVIYAEHGEGAGYFYAFGTSDLIQCRGIQCWRSKDLANWEYTGVALEPDPLDTWAYTNYWAPEIIYDDELGLYFLFYNAEDKDSTYADKIKKLSVAYSENVMGPYTIPDGFVNGNGEMLEADKPVYDFIANADKYANTGYEMREFAIDASPFIDPVTGKRYLYWSWYDWVGNSYPQEIFGMEMEDWFTPKYETLSQITQLGYAEVVAELEDGEEVEEIDDPKLNEGPFMYYKDGTYFMTYSCYGYTDPDYQVRLAVSTEGPLSGFRKIDPLDGGTVLQTDPTWNHITSAGHHCFLKVGEQLYIAYHTFYDRSTIQGGRALAVDEVEFVKNSEDILTMHTNGPTYSLQPIPAELSGYANVAEQAEITVTGLSEDSSSNYLVDNLIKFRDFDLAKETHFAGPATITFEFENAVNLKAIMVYNSYFYDTSFVQIDSALVEYVCDSKGNTKTVDLGTIGFDFDWNAYKNRAMEPGGASICEFDEIPVKKLTLKINFNNFAISEIKLLANVNKEATYKESTAFLDTYTYNNTVVLNDYVNEGSVLGGTNLYQATYGWDFTHDGTSEDSYVFTTGLADSYVYFKDVVSTKFYAEGYIGTFAASSYSNDQYPKIGMAVRNQQSCMFFYIDAANQYSNKAVGFTQSKVGLSGDWDWAVEALETLDITYKNSSLDLNGNYVKLAIYRDGNQFFMLVNDEVVFTHDNLRALSATEAASVGFLGFNSPLIVKDYYCTTESSELNKIFNDIIAK